MKIETNNNGTLMYRGKIFNNARMCRKKAIRKNNNIRMKESFFTIIIPPLSTSFPYHTYG